MKYSNIILGGLVAFAGTAVAMPTQEETKKVEPLVLDLMKDDQVALKSGKKTRVEVAESAMALADKADSEAAKLLLMKGAFNLYVRAGEFDKAIETLQALQAAIPDIPPANMANIIEASLRVVSRKNGGQLYRLLDETKTRMRYTSAAKKMEKSLKENPNDRQLRTKLAEHYAYLGKWDKALENFIAADGKAGAIAKAEQSGEAGEKVADFWWSYPTGKADELEKAFRAHAAKLYEDAIAVGKITGLNKVQAERRIEETKGYGENIFEADDRQMIFDVGNGEKFKLLRCAPGVFILDDGPQRQSCKVKITRPFWLGEFDVSIGLWNKVMGESKVPNNRQNAAGGYKSPVSYVLYTSVLEFCEKLTTRYKANLPNGYVFRIPTYAEWRYAAEAGSKEGSAWYNAVHKKENLSKYGIQLSDIHAIVKDSSFKCWDAPSADASIKSPNPWGFFGMIGNVERRVVLDAFDPSVPGDIKAKGIDKSGNSHDISCRFPQSANDWFHWSDNKERHHLALKQMGNMKDEIGVGTIGWYGIPESKLVCAFRICLGPDLVSEWKARQKK